MKRWLVQHGAYVVLSLALCGTGVYTLLRLTHDADANSAALLTSQAKFNAVLDAFNRPGHDAKGHLQPQGTIQNLNDLIHDARGMITPLNKMVNHEQLRLNTLDGQEAAIYQKSIDTLGKLQDVSSSLNDDLAAAKPAISALAPLEIALTNSVKGLQPMETQLTALIQESQPIAVNLQILTFHAAGVAADTHKVADHFEKTIDHPGPKTLMQKIGIGWKILWQAGMLAK